jgi:hypothetical protein
VLFQDKTPFKDVGIHGRVGSDTTTGPPGSYKYAVSVALESGMQVDDPEIIVE